MQHSIQGQILKGQSTELVELFGYTTKGIPGLEIIGIGPSGRQIKEKLIFIARSQKLKISSRRFVLCLESHDLTSLSLKHENVQWLELPLFVLLMTLGGVFPFYQLSNCFCAGRIDLHGRIEDWHFSPEFIEAHSQEMKESILMMNNYRLNLNRPIIYLNEFYHLQEPTRSISS